jgi:NAD(P)-dependent dehydrogenase (short-subunit alcohol dehydrogenase family)
MSEDLVQQLFDLSGKVAVVTGGAGVLCSTLSRALGKAGAKVAVLDIAIGPAEKVAQDIVADGGEAIAVRCNVLDKASIEAARDAVVAAFGRVDILINGAGGNKPEATTGPDKPFFDLPADAVEWVFNLNFIGTLLPSQVFGRLIADQGTGSILNISSMNAFRPLTKIPAYSGAKAAVSNFTQWLAVHMSQEYSTEIRVNAIAPGFFLTDQNRFLLLDEASGEWTPRGQQILDHTPMGLFGKPEDLIGTVLWLLSPGAQFVHGVVVPIDGGFSAYSGV